MTEQIAELIARLETRGKNISVNLSAEKIMSFQTTNHVLLPQDMIDFFSLDHHLINRLDDTLFNFYSLDEFTSIDNGLAKWRGSPDYGNIINTLERSRDCFVFADYFIHLFAYAIRLSQAYDEVNEVYMICGDKYKMVGRSFSDFLKLYLTDSIEIITI